MPALLPSARVCLSQSAQAGHTHDFAGALTPDRGTLRAKDVRIALGIGIEPKDTEGIRATLRRLVNRQILTETQPS